MNENPHFKAGISGAGGEDKSVAVTQALPSQFIPVFATRSKVALWMSLMKIIAEHPGNAWFWTLTFAEVMPFHYAANCHRNLMVEIAHSERSGLWPKTWGGVKVAEPHPGGHGLHFHWVVGGRIPIRRLMVIAGQCGFGRINVHPDAATPKVASYLCKYLIKGKTLPGLRQWSCIGHFEGVRTMDVEMTSRSINTFRQAFREAMAAGLPKGAAMVHAKKVQLKFDHEHHDGI